MSPLDQAPEKSGANKLQPESRLIDEANSLPTNLESNDDSSQSPERQDADIDFKPQETDSEDLQSKRILPELELSGSVDNSSRRMSTGEAPGGEGEQDEKKGKRKVKRIELEPVHERPRPLDNAEANEQEIEKPIESDKDYWSDRPRLTKEELQEKAAEHISDPEALTAFNQNIDKLEERAQGDGVSQVEKETFYGQVGKVLDASATGNDHYSGEKLSEIAQAMMKHGGAPGTVNQGVEPTCTTAALESVLYSKEPNTIGEVVSEAALTGQYVTASGDTIKIPERNLLPDKYKADTPEAKQRSLASHIFQPLSINMKWNNQDSYPGQGPGKAGDLVYEEGHPKAYPGDPQTRIMDYSGEEPEPVSELVSTIDPLQDNETIFAPMQEDRPVNAPLMFMDDLPKIYSDLKGREGSLTTVNIEEGGNVDVPENQAEFEKLLESTNQDGTTNPLLLGVHANLEPFTTDLKSYSKNQSKEEQARESAMHAHHAVAVFGYDPETKMVEVENQWGPLADHTGEDGHREKIHVDDLYRAFKGLSAEERQALLDKEPDEKPSPDDIIDSQKDFVNEIAADEDQDPEKVWHERRELYRRLSHFDREDEAAGERDTLIDDFDKLTKDADYDELERMGKLLIGTLRGGGEAEAAKEISRKIEERFGPEFNSKPDQESGRQVESLLELHQYAGDQEAKVALLDKYLDSSFEDDTRLDIGDKKDRRILLDNLSMAEQHGDEDLTKAYFDNLIQELNDLETEKGDSDSTVLEAKAQMLLSANYMDYTDSANDLASQLEPVYEDLSKGITSEEEYLSEPVDSIRSSLTRHYRETKQPEKLASIYDEEVAHREQMRMEDGKPVGPDSEELMGPLRYMGNNLLEAGGAPKAEEYLSRSLELAKQHDPQSSSRIALDLAKAYFVQGKNDAGEKLIEEYNFSRFYFRRYLRK